MMHPQQQQQQQQWQWMSFEKLKSHYQTHHSFTDAEVSELWKELLKSAGSRFGVCHETDRFWLEARVQIQ